MKLEHMTMRKKFDNKSKKDEQAYLYFSPSMATETGYNFAAVSDNEGGWKVVKYNLHVETEDSSYKRPDSHLEWSGKESEMRQLGPDPVRKQHVAQEIKNVVRNKFIR